MTKAEAVKRLQLEENGTVDYAVPQSLVDDIRENVGTVLNEKLGNPASHFVYFYPKKENNLGLKGGIFGLLYPLTVEGKKALHALNITKGTRFNTDLPTIESLEAKDRMMQDAYSMFWNGASNPKGIINSMYEHFINNGYDSASVANSAALKLMVYQLDAVLTKTVDEALKEVREYIEKPETV